MISIGKDKLADPRQKRNQMDGVDVCGWRLCFIKTQKYVINGVVKTKASFSNESQRLYDKFSPLVCVTGV